MKPRPLLLLLFLLALLNPAAGYAGAASGSDGLQVVDLQLRWKHQFQFAGYYAALEKGFYREAGLDVRLHEGGAGKVPVDEVLGGRALYGVANSEVLYERLRGRPLVALAAIFQHSPSVLLARADSGIRTPHDLIGKRVMLMSGKHDSDFYAMFLREGIKPEGINVLPTSYDIGDLVSGKVDAFNSYLTNEPYFLKQQGVDYVAINPSHYGIDYYGDILFTTEDELEQNPERVEALRAATLRGWRYAMDNVPEIIDLLIEKYRVNKTREHLVFEANSMRSLILPDLVEIGHMNPGRWQAMADAFKMTGMADQRASTAGFIYDPNPRFWAGRIRMVVLVLGSVIGIVLIVVLVMYGAQMRLKREIALRKDIEARFLQTNALLEQTGKMAKVGGWEFDFVNNRHTWTEEAERIREIPPGTVLTYEQSLAFYDAETHARHQAFREAAIRDGTPWEHESLLTTTTGKRVWVHGRGEAVMRDGKTVLLRGTIQDITDRKHAELALLNRSRELEMHNRILRQFNQGQSLSETLGSMIRQIEALHPEMLCSVLLVDQERHCLRHGAAPSLSVEHTSAVEGMRIAEGVCSSGTAAFRGERVIVEDALNHPYFEHCQNAARLANRRACWSQPIKDNEGCVLGVFAIYHREPVSPSEDEIVLLETYASLAALVIERNRTEEKIRSLAFYDTLTQLPNRRMLDDRLNLAMASSKRSGRYGALMFLDLDNFKPLNDAYGHVVGDLLLVQVASRILACVREMDTVARFGGDEFVVMLSELAEDRGDSAAQASLVAEKIRGVLAEPYALTIQHNGCADRVVEHRCTASIGVVLFLNHEATLDDILKWADAAMYQAKDVGRDAIRFHEPLIPVPL